MPDKLSQKIFGGLLRKEEETRSSVSDVQVGELAKLLIGAEFAEGFNYKDFVRLPANLVNVSGLWLTGRAVAEVGDRFGGKSIFSGDESGAEEMFVPPRGTPKGTRFVEAIRAYSAQTPDEFNMTQGERFKVVKEDSGDGFLDVERHAKSDGKVAGVPIQCVEFIW